MSNLKDEKNEDLELFKSINNFYVNKAKGIKIEEKDNILIKYLKDPKIIKTNKNNLSLFINELSDQIKKNNDIILPFINPCYDLIESFLNIDDNIRKEIFIDDQIFIQLIENSFINRRILIPIYAYFTELYSDVDNDDLKESDKKITELDKYIHLWKLFY